MEIWLILNGEKRGPFPDYQIRSGIEHGDYDASIPAWHEGMPEWQTLGQIAIFQSQFQPETPGPSPEETENPAPQTPQPPHLWRRFWARWLDLFLFSAFWWLAMWFAKRDIESTMGNLWIMATQFVPWFVLETILIHKIATTPGKWLLGIRVLNADGGKLTLAESTRRSLRVLISGIGFGLPTLSLFCQGLSVFTTRRIGRTLWDHLGNHRPLFSSLRPSLIIVVVLLYIAALHLHVAVFYSALDPDEVLERFPQLKEYMEKNPPRHFPRRSN